MTRKVSSGNANSSIERHLSSTNGGSTKVSSRDEKSVVDWSVDEVASRLKSAGFDDASNKFRDHGITGKGTKLIISLLGSSFG
jgi:hypothetical protein